MGLSLGFCSNRKKNFAAIFPRKGCANADKSGFPIMSLFLRLLAMPPGLDAPKTLQT